MSAIADRRDLEDRFLLSCPYRQKRTGYFEKFVLCPGEPRDAIEGI
jgi:hypothetical protein